MYVTVREYLAMSLRLIALMLKVKQGPEQMYSNRLSV